MFQTVKTDVRIESSRFSVKELLDFETANIWLPSAKTILVSVLFVQALLVSYTFPLTELFTQKPLFHNDAAFHWYQMKMMVNLAQQGHLTGYDPFFNAGYIGGINFNG